MRSVSVASSPSAKGTCFSSWASTSVDHYQRERNHQGLDNQLLQRPPPPVSLAADVQRREEASGRMAQFLSPGGRMSGRPITRTLRGRGAHAGRAPAVPGLLCDRAAVPPRDHRRDPSAAVRHVDGADGPQCDGPGRWLLAPRPLSDSRPRPALHALARSWRAGVSSRSVSRRRVPISTRMPSGSSALFKRSVSVASSPSAKGTLRLLVGEDVDHDHRERNHQGLDNQLLHRPPPPVSLAADVQRRERLGGWLNFYHREAA